MHNDPVVADFGHRLMEQRVRRECEQADVIGLLSELQSYQTIYIPYENFSRPSTGTAASSPAVYYTDAYLTKKGIPFPDGATTSMCFSAALPNSLDETASLYAAVEGIFGLTASTGNVVWNIVAQCSKSGAATTATNTGTNLTVGYSKVHTLTTPVALTNASPKKMSKIHGSVRRIGADAADTMTESAYLTGLWLFYKTEKISDAWS